VIYYVFLRGQRVPEWIERVEPAGFFDVHWTDDAEVFRYADRVEVHPMFPRTAESPPVDLVRAEPERPRWSCPHYRSADHVELGVPSLPVCAAHVRLRSAGRRRGVESMTKRKKPKKQHVGPSLEVDRRIRGIGRIRHATGLPRRRSSGS
jgi:hypothetical protein